MTVGPKFILKWAQWHFHVLASCHVLPFFSLLLFTVLCGCTYVVVGVFLSVPGGHFIVCSAAPSLLGGVDIYNLWKCPLALGRPEQTAEYRFTVTLLYLGCNFVLP